MEISPNRKRKLLDAKGETLGNASQGFHFMQLIASEVILMIMTTSQNGCEWPQSGTGRSPKIPLLSFGSTRARLRYEAYHHP